LKDQYDFVTTNRDVNFLSHVYKFEPALCFRNTDRDREKGRGTDIDMEADMDTDMETDRDTDRNTDMDTARDRDNFNMEQ
jgi:hypothetical protein